MATGSDEVYETENRSTHEPSWLVGARTTDDAENEPNLTPSIVGLANAEENVSSDWVTLTVLANSSNYDFDLHWETFLVLRDDYEDALNRAIERQELNTTGEIDDEADVVQVMNELFADENVSFAHVSSISIGER